MRTVTIAGILLMVVGAFVLFFGGSFTSRRDVLEVGGLTVTAEERRPIAPWAAGAAVLAGFTLVLVTEVRRKA
ncbi:MAG TPA: hypothetical protein VGB42_01255 [Candidatus Thermoplasmatota archaeon]